MIHPQGFAASLLADAPEAYWALDDVGTSAADGSGNGHTGTYYTPYSQTQTPAHTAGNSVAFSGGRVVVPNATSLHPQGDYTVEGYLKWSGTGYYGMVFGNWTPAYPYAGVSIFANLDQSASQADGKISFRDDATRYVVSNASNLNDGTWRHYAFVRRGLALELYIDGVLENSSTLTSVIAHSPKLDLHMMGRDTVQQVQGSADEMALHMHALLPGDIRQRVRQGKEPPPVVSVPGKSLPSTLDRWLEPGSLVALYDQVKDRVELYELLPAGEYTQRPFDEDLLAQTTVRAIRTADSVAVYFEQLHTDRWLKRSKSLKPRLVPVASSGLNVTWTYSYDAVGNVVQMAKPSGTEAFEYDLLDRLDAYTLPGSSQVVYAYDAVGNRLSETQSGVTQNHTYGTTDNRLTSQAGSAIVYDSGGNPTSDRGGDRTFTYDQAGRVLTVTDNAVLVATYTYNALGQRVRKIAGATDRDFVYDQSGLLLGEYENGAVVKEYVYFDGVPLAQLEGSETTWLHADHLGTPRIGTDDTQRIVWRWNSDPFGEAAPEEDPDGDLTDVTVNLRFPGQYADVETGQYYNYFRTYDSTIGRYTQSDPIGLRGGIGRYLYAYANSVRLTDPFGLAVILNFSDGPVTSSENRSGGGQQVFVIPSGDASGLRDADTIIAKDGTVIKVPDPVVVIIWDQGSLDSFDEEKADGLPLLPPVPNPLMPESLRDKIYPKVIPDPKNEFGDFFFGDKPFFFEECRM